MILVAIGANLPDPSGRPALATCLWAVGRLAGLAPIEAVSRWYRTAPVPASDQPDYINGVVRLHGSGHPHALLAALHAIEAEAGRLRGALNAARPLDLDLLAVDDLVIEDAVILPHPRLAQRAFVLAPLCDVAAQWTHPVLRQTAATLLAQADQTGISLADPQSVAYL